MMAENLRILAENLGGNPDLLRISTLQMWLDQKKRQRPIDQVGSLGAT